MRLRLDLAYDGSDFRGWARQPGLRTVQGELEAALDMVLRTTGSSVTVAGRTDTGVHARGQVAHVDLDDSVFAGLPRRNKRSPAEELTRRVNGVVERDLRLHRVSIAPVGFDARFSASWRRYAYRIADRTEVVDPLQRNHVVTWPRLLDEDAMNRASVDLLGLNDFAAFCRKRTGATTIRSLLDLEWSRQDGILVGLVRADAFCHSMVRSLVGCLAAIGDGRKDPAWAAQVMAAGHRDPAVRVAPPHGLTLEEVCYPDDDAVAAQAEATRARRTLPEPDTDVD